MLVTLNASVVDEHTMDRTECDPYAQHECAIGNNAQRNGRIPTCRAHSSKLARGEGLCVRAVNVGMMSVRWRMAAALRACARAQEKQLGPWKGKSPR